MDFDRAMSRIARALAAEDAATALDAARALKAALLAQPETPPEQLGWARDYELRALHQLGRWSEGLALLDAGEPRPYALSPQNEAWMVSVAAEMAYRCGRPERVPALSARAAALRVAAEDLRGAVLAVRTGFALCEMAKAPAEALALAERVETLWRGELAGSNRALMAFSLHARVSEADWTAALAGQRALDRALHEAAMGGDAEGIRARILEGARVDAVHPGFGGLPTPLIAAAFAGHLAAVEALLFAGAAVDDPNVQGRTALHLAADQGHAAVVARLLQAGSCPNRRDLHGQTPLHLAAWQDHLDSVRALLAGGADAEVQDNQGMTALALAATEPVPRVVLALTEAGAEVDAATPAGQTPLMMAAMNGQEQVARVLLAAGAGRQRSDAYGLRAVEWARRQGHGALVELLAQGIVASMSRSGAPRVGLA